MLGSNFPSFWYLTSTMRLSPKFNAPSKETGQTQKESRGIRRGTINSHKLGLWSLSFHTAVAPDECHHLWVLCSQGTGKGNHLFPKGRPVGCTVVDFLYIPVSMVISLNSHWKGSAGIFLTFNFHALPYVCFLQMPSVIREYNPTV